MAAKSSFGVKFSLGAPTTLTEVGDLTNISPPETTQETIDSTTHGSAGGIREFIAALINSGIGTITFNYIPGGTIETMLRAAVTARSTRPFKITFPATTGSEEYTGICVPTAFTPAETPVDGKFEGSFSFQVTGAITMAAVA
jgi:predicted secreted protein